MQVEREFAGSNIFKFSGERVRNTWAIYREVRNNPSKGELMPDVISLGHPDEIKAGDRKAWRFTMSPRPISLMVR